MFQTLLTFTLLSSRNDAESAKLLLGAGADINAKERNNYTPIIMASALGNERVLELFCNAPSADVNFQVRPRAIFHV